MDGAGAAKLHRRASSDDIRMSPQKLPPLRTSYHESTRPRDSFQSATSNKDSARSQRRQRYVVADPVAFRYLEHDPTTTVLGRNREISGYQAYVVEQWACSRTHPTFVVVSYTGDPSHKILAGVLSVPADEDAWTPKLRVYFKSLLQQYNGKRRDTPLGTLIVTNLSAIPSSLTLIPIVSGDVKSNREDFFVNEGLKRLGCSGRVGMTLAKPSPSTEAKFHQLYRTSEKIPLYPSVIELVKLCQMALNVFGKLGAEYSDGLLCDVTERAVANWWVDIGAELYNTEPSENGVRPTTVAALLGAFIGARNRLHVFGAPVGKDAFELDSTKRGIAYFQKAQKLPKTRRLDRATILRLHKVTQKQANAEGWGVPRAVKSTVAELSGKGGEMVMDIVSGGKEKSLIAEVETTDIERFTEHIKGDRAKWLWYGKPHKRHTRDLFGDEPRQYLHHASADPDTKRMQDLREAASKRDSLLAPSPSLETSPRTSGDFKRYANDKSDPDSLRKQTVLNRAKGRFKGAVGIHGHSRSSNKQDDSELPPHLITHAHTRSDEDLESEDDSPFSSSPDFKGPSEFSSVRDDDLELSRTSSALPAPAFSSRFTATPIESQTNVPRLAQFNKQHRRLDNIAPNDLEYEITRIVSGQRRAAERMAKDTSIEGGFPKDSRPGQHVGLLLRSSRSFSKFEADFVDQRNQDWWPRSLSFSAAEDAIFGDYMTSSDSDSDQDFDNFSTDEGDIDTAGSSPANNHRRAKRTAPKQVLAKELIRAAEDRRLRAVIADIGSRVAYPAKYSLSSIKQLTEMVSEDIEQLNELYFLRSNDISKSEQDRHEIIEGERADLTASLKDVETLQARLDYEIDTLAGKVEDVEDAVSEFERQVLWTEGRVNDLVRDGHNRNSEGWIGWLSRITGLNSGVSRRGPPPPANTIKRRSSVVLPNGLENGIPRSPRPQYSPQKSPRQSSMAGSFPGHEKSHSSHPDRSSDPDHEKGELR